MNSRIASPWLNVDQGSGVHVVAVWQAGHDQCVLEHGLSAASPDMPQVGCAGVADAVVGEKILHDGFVFVPCAELPCMAFDVEEREVFAVLIHADASHIVGCGQAVLRDGEVHAAAVGVESLDGEAQFAAVDKGVFPERGWQMVRACDAVKRLGCFPIGNGLHDDAPLPCCQPWYSWLHSMENMNDASMSSLSNAVCTLISRR